MRRNLSAVAIILITAACQPAPPPPVAKAPSLVVEPHAIAELTTDLQEKKATAVALTQRFLDRIATVDDAGPTLNAVIVINPGALDAAKLLDACDPSQLQWACLGHLSAENNSPEVALATHRERHGDRFPIFCADRDGALQLPRINQIKFSLQVNAASA